MAADAEDKKILDLVRAHDKEVADLIEHLLSSGHVTYPLHNVHDFANALGGANTKTTVGGKSITIGQLISKVPGYYFPIADEHELVAKIADLSLQHGGHGHSATSATTLMPATAHKPPHPAPNIPHSEHQKAMAAHPGLHLGGLKKP
ncbi:MAG: hypothetical protein E6J90_03100 [Deltaproteobacteria bacterium]|nr:MAG: hypothetical protein E6J91_16545 [Deltaproteobacteria bacterium]TMQ27148.1 MAG: hypothetical protein E6J90_03100 [Deltaproteobacteria bacterium]